MIKEVKGDPDWSQVHIGISAAKWNSMVTDEMVEGAVTALTGKGIPEENVTLVRCPGSYELPLSCKQMLDHLDVDGIVAIGAVIRGGTPHFEYVCDAVNRGILELNLTYNKPVAFGVLTTDTVEQAVERASMEKGNKGAEAALALCDMIALDRELRKRSR
jgi:6,7-dimethyl-8-ribityllumazine synthase